jgi:hypothetical protein
LYDNEQYTLDIVGVVSIILNKPLSESQLDYYHSTMLDVEIYLDPIELNELVNNVVDGLLD